MEANKVKESAVAAADARADAAELRTSEAVQEHERMREQKEAAEVLAKRSVVNEV